MRFGKTSAGQARELPLPAGLVRNDSAYRTLAHDTADGMVGLGLLDKAALVVDCRDFRCDHYGAIYVLRGSGVYRDSTGVEARFRQGSLFQRLHDRHHSVTFDPGARFAECFVALNIPLAERLMAMRLIDARRPVLHPGLDLGLVGELERTIARLRRAEEHQLPQLTRRLLDALLDLLTRDRGDPDGALIADACRALSRCLDERISLRALAARSGMSYEGFRKLFRARMGISPGAYRIRRRIERARELLDEGRHTVKAISEQLGYANPYVLSAQFKRTVGMSPEAYRWRGVR
jgi:AraC-like DNA-binding protein